jgi:hypothetical protein
MANKDDLFEQAFKVLEQEGKPTEQQKDRMLNHILMECKAENSSSALRLKRLVVTYPWRFAFAASVVQTVVFTMIFGTQYTNLFLSFFGG